MSTNQNVVLQTCLVVWTIYLFWMNTLPSQTKSLHFLNPVTITFVNFAVSAQILTSKQPAPLPPPLSILNSITVTRYRVLQKKSIPRKLIVSHFAWNFADLLAVHIHIRIYTSFCRLTLIFHQTALIFYEYPSFSPYQVLSRPIHPENENAAFRKWRHFFLIACLRVR